MNTTWWAKLEDLDEVQKGFIDLPVTGKYLLEGPPGSGKTNLLLLRALYVAGSGDKNILFLTYTKTLADFIRSGILVKGLIEKHQIKTYHSWAFDHVRSYLGTPPFDSKAEFNDELRALLLERVKEANEKLPYKKLYSAIFVDEAQDLSLDELDYLLCLTDNICICGDLNQGIYNRNGLDIANHIGLDKHSLKRHYRIGQRIAKVADRICPPVEGNLSLEDTSNYNAKVYGVSTAQLFALDSRDQQFEKMVETLDVQLVAFNGDALGIICGRNDTIQDLKVRFKSSHLKDKVCFNKLDGEGFSSDKPIHVLSAHSAKGTEFRALHIFGAEDFFGYHMDRRSLSYTAVTRAKTSLSVYRTGPTNSVLENAFAEPAHMDLSALFPG